MERLVFAGNVTLCFEEEDEALYMDQLSAETRMGQGLESSVTVSSVTRLRNTHSPVHRLIGTLIYAIVIFVVMVAASRILTTTVKRYYWRSRHYTLIH